MKSRGTHGSLGSQLDVEWTYAMNNLELLNLSCDLQTGGTLNWQLHEDCVLFTTKMETEKQNIHCAFVHEEENRIFFPSVDLSLEVLFLGFAVIRLSMMKWKKSKLPQQRPKALLTTKISGALSLHYFYLKIKILSVKVTHTPLVTCSKKLVVIGLNMPKFRFATGQNNSYPANLNFSPKPVAGQYACNLTPAAVYGEEFGPVVLNLEGVLFKWVLAFTEWYSKKYWQHC